MLWPAKKNPQSSKACLNNESSTWGTEVFKEMHTWGCDSVVGLIMSVPSSV